MELYLLLIIVPLLTAADFLGPAFVKIHRIEKCQEDGPGVSSKFVIRKANRTHQGISFDVVNPIEVGRETVVNITVSKWGDGGWKPHVFDMIDINPCELLMKFMKDRLISFLRKRNLPEICPFKKGTYRLENYVFDGNIDFPVMYGEFKSEGSLWNNGVTLLCIRVYAMTEPKKTNTG